MPLRGYFRKLVELRGAEVLLRPDIDELLAAEGAFDALPALRFITHTAARSGTLASLAKCSGDPDEARRLCDRFLARTGFRPDMAASVLEAAAAALDAVFAPGSPRTLFPTNSVIPYGSDGDEPSAEAAEPLVPYGGITTAEPLADNDILAGVTAAIEIRRDNEARRGARIINPACVLVDKNSMTITFELSRVRTGTAAVAVARYAVYDTAGRIADTDYAGDITPGDTNPLPVKCTIPVGPTSAARLVLFLD